MKPPVFIAIVVVLALGGSFTSKCWARNPFRGSDAEIRAWVLQKTADWLDSQGSHGYDRARALERSRVVLGPRQRRVEVSPLLQIRCRYRNVPRVFATIFHLILSCCCVLAFRARPARQAGSRQPRMRRPMTFANRLTKSMKPTASFRNKFSVLATTPSRGLSQTRLV